MDALGLDYPYMTLEQPTLEFLLTDKFGIVHTGKRPLQGLTARFVGQVALDYPINLANNELYGKAFRRANSGYLHIDAAGTGLQFTGSTYQMTSFTNGVYLYLPQTTNVIWGEVVHHNYDGYGDGEYYHFRLLPHIENGASPAKMVYFTPAISDQYPLDVEIPVAKRAGWVHLTFTFDATSGSLKGFIDGHLVNQVTISNWQARGDSGAYA